MTATTETPYPCATAYELSEDQIAAFRRDGFIKLKNVFSAEELAYWRPIFLAAVQRQKERLQYADQPMEKRSLYQQAFLQIMNLWVKEPDTKAFACNRRLARIATELLEIDGVRMYHDQALYKEPGGGFTPWHTDQRYWPLSSDRSITAWIPFHAVPAEQGPLAFARASQHLTENRELAISAESEEKIDRMMKLTDCEVIDSPYDLGEVSFHLGNLFHRATPNETDRMRETFTVIYIDKDMRMDVCERTAGDATAWCPGVEQDEIIASDINPVLFER